MSLTGKKELLATIEQQREKISKYEIKLSDLVRAYKSLSKEREALQASLIALSQNPVTSEDSEKNSEAEAQNQDEQGIGSSNSAEKTKSESDTREITSLKNKITTLTSTLQTCTDEKNKLEQSTKSERIRILEEKKQVEEQLKQRTDDWSKLQKEYETKLQDVRSKIIVFQHEREKEATNGIMMLREVESRLSKERSEKERMEKLLDETQEQNRQFALAIGTRNQEKKQQKQIIDLQNELEQVRCRLQKAEEQCNEPPMLKILQDQMEQMRNQYTQAILQEQTRAESAENSVRRMSQTHEERVAALESSLAELSITAADCDKRKQTYIQTIHSLRERIAELSDENKYLQSKKKADPASRQPNEKADVNTIVKKFISLWNQLNQLDENKSVGELLINYEIIHKKCYDDYKALETTVEELKAKSVKENDGNCRCGLKEQADDLRERIRSMNSSIKTTEALHGRQVASLKDEIIKLRLDAQENVKQKQQEHKGIVGNLEQQLGEHCQRSITTLQERDEEIHRLSKEIFKLNKEAEIQPSTVAAALLSQVSTVGADGPLLHHFEDLARRELEVSKLRKEKIQLEKSMRDIQMTMIEKQQNMHDTIDDLREEADRLKRNASRENENMEYLKNVVLQYMTCVDGESRLVILNALAAVLKFTSHETESVKKCLALWWWQAPDKKKGQSHRRRPSVISFGSSTTANASGSGVDSLKSNRGRFLSENEF